MTDSVTSSSNSGTLSSTQLAQMLQNFENGKVNLTKDNLEQIDKTLKSQGNDVSGLNQIIDHYDSLDPKGTGIDYQEYQVYSNAISGASLSSLNNLSLSYLNSGSLTSSDPALSNFLNTTSTSTDPTTNDIFSVLEGNSTEDQLYSLLSNSSSKAAQTLAGLFSSSSSSASSTTSNSSTSSSYLENLIQNYSNTSNSDLLNSISVES